MERKAKFKVGDLVKVKKDLSKIKRFECGYNSDMKKYEGKVYEIKEVDDVHCYEQIIYKLKEDENCYSWDERAFEFVDELTPEDIEFGDIITLRNEERYVYADEHIYGETQYSDSDGDDIDCYDENLMYDDEDENMREYDIVKVERNGGVIFRRNEKPIEMTVAEISEKLGYEVKIVKEK